MARLAWLSNPGALWVWPLPALASWTLAWLVLLGVQQGFPAWAGWLAPVLACVAGAAGAWLPGWGVTWWRKTCIALGFPLSLVLTGAATMPAWAWLVPLACLWLVYPIQVWRDAPMFPTPRHALLELSTRIPLPLSQARGPARVLDAGCGLGHGLRALRGAYPHAQCHGLERSRLLRYACAVLCPWASIWQGDMWQAPWQGYDLVYLFQRPETMARAYDKAMSELAPGGWLVSLDFPVPDQPPTAHWRSRDGRGVWAYQR